MKKNTKKNIKKVENPKKNEPMSPEKKLILKLALIFVIFGTVLCTLIFGAIYLYKAVCSENSNYILRNIEVISNGYWSKKDKIAGNFLKLKIGKDNIFKLDLKAIKNKTMLLPGVKYCEVRRILPDTLQLEIIERVPRAKIAHHNSYLIDEEGIVLLKKYCMTSAGNLPLITGVSRKKKFTVNKQVPEFANAMQILLMCLRYYSDIEIIAVDVSDSEFLKFYIRYAGGRMRQAIMPNSTNGADLRLKALRTALIRSHVLNDSINIYNLSFEGRIVCQ